MLTFRDSEKSFKSNEDLLKTLTKYNFNVTHSNPGNQKLVYEFGKEIIFDNIRIGRNTNGDKSLVELFKSPSIMVSASDVSTSYKRKSFSNTKVSILQY